MLWIEDFYFCWKKQFTVLTFLFVIGVSVAQWLEHCVSTAKVVGSIPREHMY